MTVSVIVSIATSPMTGAASLSNTRSISLTSMPAVSAARESAFTTPGTFFFVPFSPVVRYSALETNSPSAPSAERPKNATSVLEFPISTPATYSIATQPIEATKKFLRTRFRGPADRRSVIDRRDRPIARARIASPGGVSVAE
jgi:hypothetical protein